MSQKDYFSGHSKIYAAFRPTYPEELYQFIFSHLKTKQAAWDCATGNGQVAMYLSKHFNHVDATDISQQQLENAFQASNITYSVSAAEKTHFESHKFDLITVGQALHWFDRHAFYNEAKRVLKPHGLLAVWGYALLNVNADIDKFFLRFYHEEVGPYWDEARRLVESEYKGIEFPFHEILAPRFAIKVDWTIDQFGGYLSSWSATQKYIKQNLHDPVPAFIKSLAQLWKRNEVKTVTFPLFLRLGTAD